MNGTTQTIAFLVDAISAQEINFFNGLLRLVLSMLLGAAVGWERKRKGQVAGVRTFALISMGACMAMLVSIYVPQEFLGLKNGDPGRIAAQVVTGVGFLGGGAMIQQRGSIRGLTTAAGIWMVATIGMAVGVGMYFESIIATILILLILTCFETWEKRHRIGHDTKVINIRLKTTEPDINRIKQQLALQKAVLTTYYLNIDYQQGECVLSLVVLLERNTDISGLFEQLKGCSPTIGINLTTQIDQHI